MNQLSLTQGPGLCGTLLRVLHLQCMETPTPAQNSPAGPCGLVASDGNVTPHLPCGLGEKVAFPVTTKPVVKNRQAVF